MKSVFYVIAIIVLTSSSLYAQNRRAGQGLVPIGWENMDSVRFGVFDYDAPDSAGDNAQSPDSIFKALGMNFQYHWGGWPVSADSSMGMSIVRGVTGASDTLEAYRSYEAGVAGLWCLGGVRDDAIQALRHPNNKKFAIDYSVQGWGRDTPLVFKWDIAKFEKVLRV